jgi:hypothetical protein
MSLTARVRKETYSDLGVVCWTYFAYVGRNLLLGLVLVFNLTCRVPKHVGFCVAFEWLDFGE